MKRNTGRETQAMVWLPGQMVQAGKMKPRSFSENFRRKLMPTGKSQISVKRTNVKVLQRSAGISEKYWLLTRCSRVQELQGVWLQRKGAQ